MAIGSVTSSAAASAASASTPSASLTGSSNLAGNFQAFLALLTTQLKTQNPLDPLDTNQFTQELVQFASVEQQLKTNQNLDSLVKASSASSAASVVSYIGTDVTAAGDKADLSKGSAKWNYTLPADAPKTTITVKDGNGNIVYTEAKPLPAGSGVYQWNGLTSTGTQAADGTYQISIDARDAGGKSVSVSTDVSGQVSGVDLSGSGPVLLVGSRRVPIANVTSVRAHGS